MWISPSYQDTYFQRPHTIDTKIILFEDRLLGWKLNIADYLINGKNSSDGSPEILPNPHSGYAVLDILFSYFEMIAKYEQGYTKKGKSEVFFKLGVYMVFPELKQIAIPNNPPTIQGNVGYLVEGILDLMYEGIRCGLYHSGITNGKIMLTPQIQDSIAIDLQTQALIINPQLLVPKLNIHLINYVGRLKNTNNLDLRSKFETRFDFDNRA